MSPEEQSAEIEKLKQHIRTQDVELKYLRSTNDLNSAWKSACDQKDETIKYQQQELEKSVTTAEQLRVENKKLYTDLWMQELEIKCLLKNDASDFGWKVVADERDQVIKDQEQEIAKLKSKIDAVKELEINHRRLKADYNCLANEVQGIKRLERDYAKLRYKEEKSGKKRLDLEARLDLKTQELLKARNALQHMSHLMMQKPFGNAQSSSVYPSAGLTRSVKDVLAYASNGHDLPPVVISYLQTQFSVTIESLCRINNIRFNTVVIDYASGITCVQQKSCNSAATVPRDRGGACEFCVTLKRICLQKED